MEEEKKEVKKEKSIFSRVLNVILWIILLAWMALCLIDFYNTQNNKDPMFCIKKETIKYDDGKVDSCTGLGYKIYHYNRKSYTAVEYGPFWIKDKSNESK